MADAFRSKGDLDFILKFTHRFLGRTCAWFGCLRVEFTAVLYIINIPPIIEDYRKGLMHGGVLCERRNREKQHQP